MLLTIAIPAYGRPAPLRHALDRFISQIAGKYEAEVEIIVADDASPDDSLAFVADLAQQHVFIKYVRRSENIGLERNLIECAADATGEFLWIFGDDDFLEPDDAMDDILARLRAGRHDMFVLNRTRRSGDLTECITDNWMRLDGRDRAFPSLRTFCLKHGFISVIGFISVNIFRRAPFQAVDAPRFYGTMYPQLGAMLEAFHARPVELVARPLVCHRTQTASEKRAALGTKASEADFMADTERRNALYFSHPYISMLDRLVKIGAFKPADIARIPENTVINGLLVDFLIDCVDKSGLYPDRFSEKDWKATELFFRQLPLSRPQKAALAKTFDAVRASQGEATHAHAARKRTMLTISVVTPSFNQADFLDECLSSVRNQTYKPIEHLVFDPGSTDGSRDIARKYSTVTLFEEPDDGQSDALNKGFERAKGDIIAWLNSDDVFASPEVFQRVVDRFNAPDAPDIVYGDGVYIDENNNVLRDVYVNKDPSTLPWRLQQEDGILQPALFMRRSVVERVGKLTDALHYCMDYEYWIRCMQLGVKFVHVKENFALARYHATNKTYGQRGNSYAEVCEMLSKHFGYVNHIWIRRYAEFLAEGFDGVLAHSANRQVGDTSRLNVIYRQLLSDYNGDSLTYSTLLANQSKKGPGDTLREMRSLGVAASTPCKEAPLDAQTVPGHVLYTVGPKRWAFEESWKKQQIEKAHAFIRRKLCEPKSDTCVIVGNGPSLKKTDLSLLKGHDVIISNNAFLEPRLHEHATYYTVVNYLVAEQSRRHINRLKGPVKILPYWTAYCLNEGEDTYFIDAVGHAEFSKDIFTNASWRHTVTFYNLHIAYGLGYKRVILIGLDHSYRQREGVKEGEIVVSEERDENHFDSRYFQGKKWQAADVTMMERMYLLAKDAYAEDGRAIINATVGGALEIFPRVDLAEALAGASVPDAPNPAAADNISFAREAHANVDETAAVALLLAEHKGPQHVMLDIGAHHGSSAQYFNRLGWTIHCFEPDPKNREKLVERFGQTANITIDDRAVSDAPATGVSFYQSEESTGISGLSAFRDSHVESGRVDVTTVADIVADRGVEHVDFLKIDVEGFDFSVLKGVPWDILQPDVIECEFEDAKTAPMGHTWKDIAAYLADRGYAVYVSEWHPIVRYGVAHDWRRVLRYGDAEVPADAWGNLLAFRADPGLPAVKAAFEAMIVRPKSAASAAKKPASDRINDPAGRSDRTVAKRRLYGPMADALKIRAPKAFTLLRFAKKTLGGLWRRRAATVPALLILTAVVAASFAPALSTWRTLIWAGAAFALVFAAIAYLGLRLRQFTEALAAENANLRQTLAITRRALRQTDQKLAALSKSATKTAAGNAAEIATLKGMAKKASDSMAALDEKANRQIASVLAESQKIEKVSARAAEKIAALEAARNKAASDLAAVSNRAAQTDRAAAFNNAIWYQRFNRRLNQEHIDTLLSNWGQALPFKLTRQTLGYMAHRACQIEAGMQGRLATTIEDILLRTLAAMSAKDRNIEVMEIGTLFGIGAGIMYDALAPHFDSVRMTLLDPLDGYYESKRLDILTGQPVTETVLRSNLERVGLNGDRLRLIKHLSTDSAALEQAGDRRYDVLVIDGDHTYDGVKADFDLYAPLMKPEGLIIFDDYGSEDWPDVQKYVDKEVEGLDSVDRTGVDWRTCVYRMKKLD